LEFPPFPSPSPKNILKKINYLRLSHKFITAVRTSDQLALIVKRAAAASCLALIKLISAERTLHRVIPKNLKIKLRMPPTKNAKGKTKAVIQSVTFHPLSLIMIKN
jgi:hypothetical protein